MNGKAEQRLVRLKYIARLKYGDALESSRRDDNGSVTVFGSNGPIGRHSQANTLAPTVIVGRKVSFGSVHYAGSPTFCIDTAYAIDSSVSKANLRWLYYAMQTIGLDEESQDTGVPGLSREKAYQSLLHYPSAENQAEIVTFLDRETMETDTLIAKYERLIELLEEKRVAMIMHAVTKGLDPNVPMKSSDIMWIGDVPAHWTVERIKWIAKLESGHTPDKKISSYWDSGNIPWVSLNDTGFLKDNDYIEETAYYITEAGIANSSAHLLAAGAVVFSRDATIGRCAITAVPMAVSQHFIAWLCGKQAMPEYLLHVLRCMTQDLERLTFGATIKTIGMPDVKTLRMPVPPIDEQIKIVSVINKIVMEIEAITKRVQSAIGLIREHRSVLITAAVTGRIDVRTYRRSFVSLEPVV
jgi:type I restriction enzyme S subunit